MSLERKLNERLNEIIDKELNNFTENYLRPNTPVRTGALRNSWRIERNSVVTDKDYAIYVEKGTPTIRPRLFIRSAITRWLNSLR